MSAYIDPHIHMISRVTDDYHRMAYAGCVALTEPAFWAGFDRGTVDGFRDYFRHLTEVEPKRAAQFHIRHYCWLCINAKEAENVELSRGVIQMIPEFLDKPNVLGIGEIGLNKNTRNEAIIFQEHVDLAMKHDELILIHTPHLEDKYKGTRMIIDMLKNDRRIRPERVLVDHVEEHTVRLALDGGFWCAMTLYPTTKCTPARAVDIIEMVGTERIMVNSAGDWGKSDPLAVPEFIQEMKRRGHPESTIRKIVHDNPLAFFRQCARWQEWPTEDDCLRSNLVRSTESSAQSALEQNSGGCPHIPLKDKRRNELRELLDKLLDANEGMPLEEIYHKVLAEFGHEDCQPESLCPHYDSAIPEYHHVVRLALNDGKQQRSYSNLRRGTWARQT